MQTFGILPCLHIFISSNCIRSCRKFYAKMAPLHVRVHYCCSRGIDQGFDKGVVKINRVNSRPSNLFYFQEKTKVFLEEEQEKFKNVLKESIEEEQVKSKVCGILISLQCIELPIDHSKRIALQIQANSTIDGTKKTFVNQHGSSIS